MGHRPQSELAACDGHDLLVGSDDDLAGSGSRFSGRLVVTPRGEAGECETGRMGMSAYVGWLRERVGHGLVLLPSVAVLCRDEDGRLLLVRQADSGQWATVGGAVEPDENPRGAARREAKEETGLDVEIGGVLDVLGGPAFRVRYPNGDETAYVSIVFDATVTGGEAAPDGDETIQVGWFDAPGLAAADLHPFARVLLTELGMFT